MDMRGRRLEKSKKKVKNRTEIVLRERYTYLLTMVRYGGSMIPEGSK